MNVLDEIRECFASTQNGARLLQSMPEEYPAMVIRNSEGYGVAIEFNNEKDVSETFANCKLFSQYLRIEDTEKKYLILLCFIDNLRYEFATVCTQFVEPGIDGIDRKNLLEEPLNWWKQWRELLGNAISQKNAYSVLAELIVFEHLYSKDISVEWTAVKSGTHDIEGKDSSYEVKSTLKRYETTVTISSQHQLMCSKNLYLYFCRLEQSNEGISLNDIILKLIADGYDKNKIEQQLFYLGYDRGSSVRETKYKVLEKRIYFIDENFPSITEKSFKEGKIPEGIIQITYTIDLNGLKYTTW